MKVFLIMQRAVIKAGVIGKRWIVALLTVLSKYNTLPLGLIMTQVSHVG